MGSRPAGVAWAGLRWADDISLTASLVLQPPEAAAPLGGSQDPGPHGWVSRGSPWDGSLPGTSGLCCAGQVQPCSISVRLSEESQIRSPKSMQHPASVSRGGGAQTGHIMGRTWRKNNEDLIPGYVTHKLCNLEKNLWRPQLPHLQNGGK